MDAERFDALARSRSATGSRRRALAVALAAALGALGRDGAEAKKKKKGKASCPPCPTCEPPEPTFCETGAGAGDCQASGPRCRCATHASGAWVCVAHASVRGNVFHCGACTGNGEICINASAVGDVAWCAIPCAVPR